MPYKYLLENSKKCRNRNDDFIFLARNYIDELILLMRFFKGLIIELIRFISSLVLFCIFSKTKYYLNMGILHSHKKMHAVTIPSFLSFHFFLFHLKCVTGKFYSRKIHSYCGDEIDFHSRTCQLPFRACMKLVNGSVSLTTSQMKLRNSIKSMN